jgi:Xaa-Pro aminopeptidase
MDTLQSLAFSVDEYKARLAAVQASLRELGLAALLVHNRADLCYLTGMENGYLVAYYAAIIPAAGEPILLASEFEMLNARLGSWCEDRVTFPVFGDPLETTCHTLHERDLDTGRLGVQMRQLTAEQYRALSVGLPEAELLAADDVVANLKVIKSPAEMAYLWEAAQLTTRGMEAALAEAAAGKTENDLAAAASKVMIRGGSEFMCIDPIVTAGRRSGVPHSTFRRNVLKPGDAILVEMGACVCRYTAPLFRTVALAPVPAEVRRAATACRESLNVLIEQMRPGAVARDVAAKAKAAWTPICQELIWHGYYAYSVGLGFPPDWNDAPACITETSDLVLRPGMCFHATTSLRQAAQFGTALSETVLITETGNEVLTGTKRELHVI